MKVRIGYDTNLCGMEGEDIIEVDDDLTDEELSEIAMDWANDEVCINSWYEILDDDYDEED